MSNIAGKAYAMNVISPLKRHLAWINKAIFLLAGTWLFRSKLAGLLTLSLIHYARWVIVKPNEFPRLDHNQPEEDLKYAYMFFFSNFNGSWEQYVDSFSSSIPTGLDLLWYKTVKYPKAVPLQPFYDYITFNQIWTNHYYNAYPMATANDVKSAKKVKAGLVKFIGDSIKAPPDEFQKQYNRLLVDLQHDISQMGPSTIVSLASEAVAERRSLEE